MVNKGKGRNYDLDFTLERYLSKGYYGLLTGSGIKRRNDMKSLDVSGLIKGFYLTCLFSSEDASVNRLIVKK